MSNLRRMMMAKAMNKSGSLMGEEFCDTEGNVFKTTLEDGKFLCWNQLQRNGDISDGIDGIQGTRSDLSLVDGHINVKCNTDYAYCGIIFPLVYPSAESKVFIAQKILSPNSFDKYQTYTANGAFNISTIIPTNNKNDFAAITNINDTNGTFGGVRISTEMSVGQEFDIYYNQIIDLKKLFCKIYPSYYLSINDFESLIWSKVVDGNKRVGYTKYSYMPYPIIASNGKLHYALTKAVRDYAESIDKSESLNVYCCEHTDEIVTINKNKYIVDTLPYNNLYNKDYIYNNKRFNVEEIKELIADDDYFTTFAIPIKSTDAGKYVVISKDGIKVVDMAYCAVFLTYENYFYASNIKYINQTDIRNGSCLITQNVIDRGAKFFIVSFKKTSPNTAIDDDIKIEINPTGEVTGDSV